MPPTCTVCRLPNRQEAEEAMLAGTPLRNIAKRFGTSPTALHRHKERHLPAKLVKAAGSREELSGQALLERVLSLSRQVEEILAEARQGKNPGLALAAIGRASALLELQGKCLTAMKAGGSDCPRCKANDELAARDEDGASPADQIRALIEKVKARAEAERLRVEGPLDENKLEAACRRLALWRLGAGKPALPTPEDREAWRLAGEALHGDMAAMRRFTDLCDGEIG